MELHQLEYFVEICRTRNFTKAAERLCVAQSSVTRAIQKLEEELGVALLDRAQKPIGLTPAGELFFPQVQETLHSLNEAVREVTQLSGPGVKTIHFGVPSWCGYKAMELLTSYSFVREHPFLFNLVERSSPEIEKRLLDGSMDIGWLIRADLSPLLHFLPVEKQEVFCVLSATSPLAERERLTFSSLSEEKFLFNPDRNSSALQNLIYKKCREEGFQPTPSFSSHEYLPNLQLILQYVRLNYGIVFMPQYIVETIASPDICIRPMDPPFLMDVGLAWNGKRSLSAYEKRFVNCVQTEYQKFVYFNEK